MTAFKIFDLSSKNDKRSHGSNSDTRELCRENFLQYFKVWVFSIECSNLIDWDDGEGSE